MTRQNNQFTNNIRQVRQYLISAATTAGAAGAMAAMPL